jgi:hypothetical protein
MDSSKRSPLIASALFIVCALADFCWGYLHNGSVSDAFFAVLFGLVGSTIFFKTMLRRD